MVLYQPEEEKPRKISKDETRLFELAEQLGYQIIDSAKLMKYLCDAIATQMTSRLGDNVYQMPSVMIPNFPPALATQLFPSSCLTADVGTTKTWTFDAIAELVQLFDQMAMLAEYSSKMVSGISRALKKPSEPWVKGSSRRSTTWR